MSAGTTHSSLSPKESTASAPNAVRRWIVNSWVDLAFILLTPLVAIPAILILSSSGVGVRAETISVIVTAFFATGHHLPGMLRAYGDRELFERFRWRFLLAPPLVFLAYFPLTTYHFDLYRLIILFWATWHGLMQVYGFVRIYDAKAGSTSRGTAYWDWLVCLCGFITPQLLRPETLSGFLGHWYSTGGPFISANALNLLRWSCVSISLIVLVGFAINYGVQYYRGPRPSLLKLLMLSSSIGMWWFAMLCVDNPLLGIALFDICHDVQYLAIVWLFNNRRVKANPHLGWFIRFVFRRGMVLLYLGLITAYGAIGLVAPLVLNGTISSVAYAVLFTSTILHYYYDGFIWKVRESVNQDGLGLNKNANASKLRQINRCEITHILKCAPILLVFGLIFTTDILSPSLTTAQKNVLTSQYSLSLMGKSVLPAGEEERSWLFAQFEQTQNVADAVQDDRSVQLRAAIMLANFGRNSEAVERLENLVKQHPDFYNAQLILGGIYHYLGESEKASERFRLALSGASTPEERSRANVKWGEVELARNDVQSAESKFAVAIQEDSTVAEAVDVLRKRARNLK